jgi:hypothetical protein
MTAPAKRRSIRPLLALAIALVGLLCVVAGVALIYPPAGLVVAGLAILASLTFDPAAARRLTWPR